MDSILRDRLSMIAALGAGVVVGLSGIYLYYKLNRNVTRELSNLSGTIESLRKEIEELKRNRSETVERKSVTTSYTSQVHQLVSASSGEEAEEEYYDFTDESEEVSNSWAALNGPHSIGIENINKDDDWFENIDRKLDGSSSEKEEAYCLLSQKLDHYSKNPEFLWRFAKATHLQGIMAHKRGELEKKKDLSFQAQSYAEQALQLDNTNPEVQKWYAITVGSLAEYVGLQEKIQNGYTFKKHVDEALRLKPSDPTLHHMLGRWCYEVSVLTWLERKIASTLFSTPPESTFAEARLHLMQAETLKPDWKENILFIAKNPTSIVIKQDNRHGIYIRSDGDYNSAITWIDKGIDLPCNSEDDELAQTELESLQYQYSGYKL